MASLADWSDVYDDLDWDDLLAPHPLNEGRVFWGLGIPPLDGGPQLYDLTQTTRGLTLTGGPTWAPTPRGDAALSVGNFGGKYAISTAVPNLASIPNGDFSAAVWASSAWTTTLCAVGWGSAGSSSPIVFLGSSDVSGQARLIWRNDAGTGPDVSGGSGLNDGNPHRLMMVKSGTSVSLYVDGKFANNSVTAATGAQTLNKFAVGSLPRPSPTLGWTGIVGDATVWGRALSAFELFADYSLSQQGYPGVLNRRSRTSIFLLSGGGAGIIGTASVTLDACTLASTGTLAIHGAAAVALDAATITSAGTLALQAAAGIALAPATLTSTGTLAIAGAAAVTLDAATLAAAGQSGGIGGTATITLDAATLASTGTLLIHGGAATTLDAATLSAAGSLTIAAASSIALDETTLVSAGTLFVQGGVSIVLADIQIIAFGGSGAQISFGWWAQGCMLGAGVV